MSRKDNPVAGVRSAQSRAQLTGGLRRLPAATTVITLICTLPLAAQQTPVEPPAQEMAAESSAGQIQPLSDDQKAALLAACQAAQRPEEKCHSPAGR